MATVELPGGWAGHGVAVVCAAAILVPVIGYHVERLALGPRSGDARTEPDVHVTHAAMAVAMIAMLGGVLDHRAAVGAAWACAAATAWFGVRAVRAYIFGGAVDRLASHAVMAAAMLYMLVITAGGTTMGGGHVMGTSVAGELAITILLGSLAVVAVRTLRRARLAPATQPLVGTACQLIMVGASMYMLAS